MSTHESAAPAVNSTASPASRFLPLLLLLFVGSGCAALMYEIVWYQIIQLVIGSSAISMGVLLGTFMGGMFLGSLFLPRFIPSRIHPLRVYAFLELGIAACALLVLYGLPVGGKVYALVGGEGLTGIFLRGVVCAVFLLPPTIMMGATLPAIARWMETTPKGVSWMGFFYGGNLAGAVVGCLFAGFYLLRVTDMATATFVAIGINIVVATFGLALSGTPYTPLTGATTSILEITGARSIYGAIALSGLTALGAEAIWTRLLSLTFGASVYTFSIILGVFLLGLGIGSTAGSFIAGSAIHPRRALGWCQLALTVAIAWAAFNIAKTLPYWPINPALAPSAWFTFQLDFVRCMWATLPGAMLWGASFPLAVASAASRGQDPARLMGGVYAANTIGAIVGALFFSIFAIPHLGTQGAQQVLIAIAGGSGLMLMIPLLMGQTTDLMPVEANPPVETIPYQANPLSILGVGVAAALAVGLIVTLPRIPGVLLGYGRYSATYAEPKVLFFGEGMNSSVAVTELDNGVRNFHVAGKIEASTESQDMRLQRMLGHISALLHPNPKRILVVGFGAGVTAGTFVLYPGIEHITICEIEPLIPQHVAPYFAAVNYDVANDPRVTIVYDDARHFILTTKDKFDVITSDPIHPWVKGAATLYTKEYFELAKRHLNPGGVITQWVPLYESSPPVVKSEIATFFDVFPKGTLWSNDINGQGYDVVLAGRADSSTINVDSIQARLSSPAYARVAQSLADVGFQSSYDLLGTYGGWGPDLKEWLVGAAINTDRNLRLQYIAGLGLNLYQNANIYDEIKVFRKYPTQLFVASDVSRAILEAKLGPRRVQ